MSYKTTTIPTLRRAVSQNCTRDERITFDGLLYNYMDAALSHPDQDVLQTLRTGIQAMDKVITSNVNRTWLFGSPHLSMRLHMFYNVDPMFMNGATPFSGKGPTIPFSEIIHTTNIPGISTTELPHLLQTFWENITKTKSPAAASESEEKTYTIESLCIHYDEPKRRVIIILPESPRFQVNVPMRNIVTDIETCLHETGENRWKREQTLRNIASLLRHSDYGSDILSEHETLVTRKSRLNLDACKLELEDFKKASPEDHACFLLMQRPHYADPFEGLNELVVDSALSI